MGPGGRWRLNDGTHSSVANSTAFLVVIGSLERDEEGSDQAESAARKRSMLRRRSARASSACAISTSTKRALWFGDEIHVGADDGADHRVAAARDRIAVQDDWFASARHLDGTVWVARIDDVRRVVARAEWRRALVELQRRAVLVAVADAVGLGTDSPGVGKKALHRHLLQSVKVDARQHTQDHFLVEHRQQCGLHRATRAGGGGRYTHGQSVAGQQLASVEAAECAQAVGRAAAKHHRHVDAAGHGDAHARAELHEVEAEPVAGLHRECGIAWHLIAVELDLRVGAGHGHQRGCVELQLGTEQRAFDDGRTFVVADQQVCEHQALLVERTRQRNAQVVVAGAAGVLHAGREAGLEHFNRHGALSGAVGCSRPGRPGNR